MRASALRFENGYQILVSPLSWAQCIRVTVKDSGGNLVNDPGPHGGIIPVHWLQALQEEVGAGKIVDRSSLREFYSKMGTAE